jgi:hypothetical protein
MKLNKLTPTTITSIALGILVYAILVPSTGALLGALALVVASWPFAELSSKIVSFTGLEMYQIGAILGVLSVYFKSSSIS